MRLTLSLAAALLLVGSGCTAATTDPNVLEQVLLSADTQVAADKAADSGTNIQATGATVTVSSTVTAPTVKTEVKVDVGTKATAKACTMDAKICPDGSAVGRTGPNCEFAACPVAKVEEKKPVETKPEEKPAETGPKTYTMAEVKAQASAGQCWTVIRAKVYDLSSWIGKHPGGSAAIQSLCGIDGTAKFTAMHGGSAKQETILATFLVGSVK